MTTSELGQGMAYTSFPDLTGWRTSAAERGSSSSFVYASHEDASLTSESLKQAACRLGAADAADVIVAAWAIVLIHLLSQDDGIYVHINIQSSAHLHLCIPGTDRRQYTISTLLQQIRQARESHPAVGSKVKLADNFVHVGLSGKARVEKATESNLIFSASRSEQGSHICLDLKASPMIHNKSSAQLHLTQVAACLKFISCKATAATPALSLRHYPEELLAGDNPLPEPLLDDIEDIRHERFEHQMERVVARCPSDIALDFRKSLEAAPGDESAGNYQWSYRELDRRAGLISYHIRAHLDKQARDGDGTPIIALCLVKSPYTYLAILAVLKAGAAWCPIDTDWPIARRKALLAKSGARIVLTAGNTVSSEIPPNQMMVIRLDLLDYKLPTPPTQPLCRTSSEDLAYLIWTSGTTGIPKAVGVQHRAAVQALRSLQRVIPHSGSDFRYLQFSAYNFDLMILDVFYTWGLGGTLCSSSRSLLLNRLVDVSNAFQATHTLLTPAVLAMTRRQSIPSLQVVINGGEKLSQVVADIWSVNCCLLNLYGPAEATLIAMSRRVPQNDAVKAPNIGRALPTVSCHVVDVDNQVVLKGAVGQLVLGGHQCAVGYIGDEDKTKDKFIEHPQMGRVYKTGDLVRQLWSGEFEYLGRLDDQIKVNGIRIELLEINSVVRNALEQVKDSETLVIKSSDGDENDTQLVNFSVVSSMDGSGLIRVDDEAVRIARELARYASANLPSYMIPSLFIIISSFPRTSSAKIDREALRKELASFDRLKWLNRLAESKEPTLVQDISPEEVTIRKHIADLCGIASEAFGRHTTFPSLGLNSIKAITLSHRLMQAGVQATVVDIVQCQTLASLVERVDAINTMDEEGGSKSAFLQNCDQKYRAAVCAYLQEERCSSCVKRVLPVTPLQEALLSETTRDKSRYWLHRAYALPSSIDVERLRQSIQMVVEKTDILRTCFLNTAQLNLQANDSPMFLQIVLSNSSVKIATVEEEEIASGEWDKTILGIIDNKLALQAVGVESLVGFLIIKGKQLQLIAVLHHSLYDQVTLGMMQDAIAACYENNTKKDVFLEPFSGALHCLTSSDDEEEGKVLKIWEKLLSKYPKGHAVAFPNLSGHDTVSGLSSTSRYEHRTSISLDTLADVAKQLHTSIRPILQAAWAAILCAHCNTSDVILGDSISLRTGDVKLENIAGPLLDTLPIPICIESTYRQIIAEIDDFHKQAISSLPVPLRHIRGMVAMPNGFPLFAAVFVFEPPEADRRQMAKESFLGKHRDFGLSVEHSVAVEVSIDADGSFSLGLVVKDAIVSPHYARIILAQWESAIHQVMAQPDSLASHFDTSCFGEDLLSVSRLTTPESLKKASTIPVFDALAKRAIDTPDAIAVEFHTSLEQPSGNVTTRTYRDLDQESTRVGQFLRMRNDANSVVAVCLHRCVQTYEVLLGILKAGLTYLPIDPLLPLKRKNDLLNYSGAACVVWSDCTQWAMEDRSNPIRIVNVDTATFLVDANAPEEKSRPPFDMSSAAYIIFTSGSTGMPKGCVLTHKNLSSAIEAFRLTYEEKAPGTLKQSTRFMARSVEAFDVAFLETLLPLQVGGTIVTAPRDVILQDMARSMQVMQITHAAVVPSLFYTEGRRIVPADLPCLRALIVGGERVAQDVITAWASSDVPLLNAYGPSEACIGTSIARLTPRDSTSNIGAPFPGTRYLVLKGGREVFRTALRGEAGELCIGGLQVGTYLGNGDSSAFIEWEGERIYRTGDEVRLGKDDITEYLGRISSGKDNAQVKIRGVRIESSEIDSVLSRASKLARFCFTHVFGDPAYLVTFIAQRAASLKEDQEPRTEKEGVLAEEARHLLSTAREKLPSYMIPRIIVPLESIPLSSISGKIDGKRLDVWYQSQADNLLHPNVQAHEDHRRDLNIEEAIVAEEIRKLLTHEAQIGPSTDVFSLGLDSLSIISLSSALRRRGKHIDVPYIIANPTLEAIARSKAKQPQMPLEKVFDYTEQAQTACVVKIASAYPLLPLQESMIVQTLSEETGGVSRYINVIRLACKERTVDRERLEGSIEEALSSHQIYKTVFVEIEGRLVQAVLSEKPSWRMNELDFETRASHMITTTLGQNPPLRYCITPANGVLFAVHHALYDGESLASLFEEIETRYHGKAVEPVVGGFGDYVEEVCHSDIKLKVQAWKDILKDSSVSLFPSLTGEKPPTKVSTKRLSVEHRPSPSLSQLKQRARQERVTLQLLLLDAFARLYARYVGQGQVLFGLVLGGRTHGNAMVHGPCINTVPCTYQAETENWKEQVQATYASAISNQHVSLPEIARHLQVPGALLNTLFSYLGPIKSSVFFDELESDLTTEYPFAVEIQELPRCDQIKLCAVFDPEHIPEQQAQIFLQQLGSLLSDSPTSTSQRSLLSIENELPVIPGSSAHFLTRFHSQVQQRPDAIAYVFTRDFNQPNEETTYRQLDEVSTAMANQLLKIEGDVIGVLLKQCSPLYPLLLAIWKADKVYLPLDPSLPLERLKYMVSVAEPALIISASSGVDLAEKLGPSLRIEDLLRCQSPSRVSQTEPNLIKAAYIMFTSGSSGTPKGVQISHLALASAIYSWSQILPYRPNSRILQLASPGFDVFLIEVCMPLALGFSFASAAKEDLLDDLEVTFSKLELTMADLPAVLAATVQPDKIKGGQPLDWLMSGGDIIEDRVIEKWSKHGLINAWGPTETTIGNTLGFVTERSSRSWVGRAYPTSSIYILDAVSNAITYRGCIGEIAVGGPQLADGYVGNKELTEEKFILLPNGVRVYKTGDRGRLLYDGSLECLGRIDSGQVKINSQRVELREIELQLKRHSGIVDALVLYLEHREMQSKQLVAFVVVYGASHQHQQNARINFRKDELARRVVADAFNKAREGLASHMIPSICLVMAGNRLPLTPNNKIDGKQLQAIYSRMSAKEIRKWDASSAFEQTHREWTTLEKQLRVIIANFCKVEGRDIERDASFYRLGIDSISGFRLLKRLREQGFHQLSLRDILQASSVSSLASLLEGQQNGQQENGTDAVLRLDAEWRKRCDTSAFLLNKTDQIKSLLSCTPLQEGLLLESLSSGLYVHHHLFKVDEDVLPSVIEAVHAMVECHDVLRTSFHLVDGRFIQAVHTSAQPQMPRVIETNNLEKAIADLMSVKQVTEESDLAKPLFSLHRIRSKLDGITVLDFCLHHALYDGETLEMIFAEVEARISGQVVKRRLAFQHLLPYLLSREQDERFITDRLIQNQSTLLDSIDRVSSTRLCHYSERLLDIKLETLVKFASRAGISVHILALYAFVKLLCQLTHQRDVVFAQLFSLRDAIAGAEEVFGPALNSVLTRANVTDGETALETLRRMQKDNDTSRDHRRASMAQVLSIARKARGGKDLEFDTLFDFQQVRRGEARQKGKKMVPWKLQGDEASLYALNIQFQQRDDSISIIAVGDATIFSQDKLAEHLRTLEQILESTVADGSQASTSMPSGLNDLSALPLHVAKSLDKTGEVESNGHPNSEDREFSEEESVVLAVVAELSQLEEQSFGTRTPINQLGLDSIMAIKLASRLRAKGLVVGVADVLQGKTVEGISRRIAEKKKANGHIARSNGHSLGGTAKEIEQVAKRLGTSIGRIEAVLPLLPGQEFELAEYIRSDGSSGVFTFLYRVKVGAVDWSKMQRAWEKLCFFHPILRTCFTFHEREARQVVLKDVEGNPLARRRLDGSFLSLLMNEGRWSDWIQKSCNIDIDLRIPPNAACIVQANDGIFLALRLHHALYDAWTVNFLVREMWRLYAKDDDVNGESPQRADHIELVKYLAAERKCLANKSEVYWRGLLKDVPQCIIGTSSTFASCSTATLSFKGFVKSAASTQKHLRSQGVSLGTAFIAAWSRCLLDLFPSHERIVFGLYRRGRSSDYDGADTVASNCMNVLPLVVHRKNSSTMSELCQSIKDQMDEQARFESTTSISDVLSWMESDATSWNTYLNLVWDDEEQQQDDPLQCLEEIAIPGSQQEGALLSSDSEWRAMRLGDMRCNLNINLHWDRKEDCVNGAMRYRSDMMLGQEVEGIVQTMSKHFAKLRADT